MLILNLICRDQKLRREIVEKLHAVFQHVYGCKLQDDVNEVLFALPHGRTTDLCVSVADSTVLPSLKQALDSLQDAVHKTTTLSKTSDVLDLTAKLTDLAIL